jgi:hypothetical protein
MELKTTLNEEMAKRYQVVKESTCMPSDNSVLAFLISKEYNRIQERKYRKVFIPNEDYDLIEKAAKAQGQTVDEYIEELTLDMLRKAKEM